MSATDRFRRAVGEFNAHRFFDCHETLEHLWLDDAQFPHRGVFQGILQVAVGFYHLSNGNFRGARNLLHRGIKKLSAFPPTFYGVNVAGLIESARRCRDEIVRLGPARLDEFDARLIPTIELGSLDDLERDWTKQ